MRIGLYEKAMPDGLQVQVLLSYARKADFDFLELSIDETEKRQFRLDMGKKEMAEWRNLQAQEGICFESMCLSAHRKYPLGSRDAAVRNKSLELCKKAVVFSAETGIKIIQLAGYDVYYEKSGNDTRSYFLEGLFKCTEYAAEAGIILGFETMETPFMDTIAKGMDYVKLINSPYLQMYPDIGNFRNGTENYLEDIECGRGHIVAAHLKETKEGVYRELFFGEGRVDFLDCTSALIKQGVQRFVCEFWYDGKSEALSYIKKAREFFRFLKTENWK